MNDDFDDRIADVRRRRKEERATLPKELSTALSNELARAQSGLRSSKTGSSTAGIQDGVSGLAARVAAAESAVTGLEKRTGALDTALGAAETRMKRLRRWVIALAVAAILTSLLAVAFVLTAAIQPEPNSGAKAESIRIVVPTQTLLHHDG